MVTAGFLIHPSCGGFAAAAACDHQPRPVRMLRTQRKEEEEEVEGDIFILHYCTAVRGGPRRAHQTLQERKNTLGQRFKMRRKAAASINRSIDVSEWHTPYLWSSKHNGRRHVQMSQNVQHEISLYFLTISNAAANVSCSPAGSDNRNYY